jgi:NitT/TauT family transport system permease protein
MSETTAADPPAVPLAATLHALRAMLGPVLFVAGVAFVWKTLVFLLKIPPFVMPPPEDAVRALLQNGWTIAGATFFTVRNAMVGLAVAFLVAVTLAATFLVSPAVSRAVLPVVIVLRTAPVLAIAPILIMVFGRGIGVAVAVVVIVSFFPIMVNAMRGFGSTPRNAVELMHVLGAGWFKTFVKVRLPFSLPYIFAGLRSAATSAILAAMLAEWLSGAPGLGKLILDASSFRKTGLLWAGVIVSMVIAYAVFSLSALLEQRSKRQRDAELELP